MWKKMALAATVVVAIASGGIAVAGAGPGDGTDAQPPTEVSTGSPLRDLGNGTTETKYVAITPCRIVDTRIGGGALPKEQARSFKVRGTTGFAAQGGHTNGCGIPASATAVEVAVTSVNASGGGYLRIYPAGSSEPTATFLNYSPYNPTNTGAVTMCKSCAASSPDITIKGHSNATDLVLDVQGYYAKPMAAHIKYDASVIVGSRIGTVTHPNTGGYHITFDRPVTGCVPVATPWYSGYHVSMQVIDANTVGVTLFLGGNLTDADFLIQVDC